MKFAQFVAVGIAMASAAAFAGGDKQRSSQSSEQQSTQAPRDQQAQSSQGQQQDQGTIKQAQEQLSAMGHDAGPADGVMGPKTQAAVKEFQQSKGLQASGQLDNQTLAALQTGGNEGRSSARSSTGQSVSSQSSSSPSSGSASPSRDTQSAAPSRGSQQSKQ